MRNRDLHLDCGRLGACDSMGLSVLLSVRRRSTAAGVRLHLDERPRSLERLRDLTGTLEFLTAVPAAGADASPPPEAPANAPERQSRRPPAGPPNG